MSNDGTESQGASIAKGCLAIFVVVLVITWACVAWATGGDSQSTARRATPPTRTLEETSFLTTLHMGPYTYTHNDSNMIDTGREVCFRMDAGDTSVQAIAYVMDAGYGGANPAAYLVGAAIGALCPEATETTS